MTATGAPDVPPSGMHQVDVVEDSPELEAVVDSGSSLKPHTTRALFAHLDEGHYAVVCNLPGHYHDGMHIDLVVRREPSGS